MAENQGKHLLQEKDFVDVVNDDGDVVASVPKHWDKDQLAPGLTKKSGRRSGGDGGGGGGSSSSTAPDPSVEPARNGSTDAWVAFARHQGAADEDLVDGDGAALSRDDLVAKYGTPAE